MRVACTYSLLRVVLNFYLRCGCIYLYLFHLWPFLIPLVNWALRCGIGLSAPKISSLLDFLVMLETKLTKLIDCVLFTSGGPNTNNETDVQFLKLLWPIRVAVRRDNSCCAIVKLKSVR